MYSVHDFGYHDEDQHKRSFLMDETDTLFGGSEEYMLQVLRQSKFKSL